MRLMSPMCVAAMLVNASPIASRAERSIVALANAETIHEHPRQYVNRLSDLLFVLSRVLNRYAGGSDVLWQHERKRG